LGRNEGFGGFAIVVLIKCIPLVDKFESIHLPSILLYISLDIILNQIAWERQNTIAIDRTACEMDTPLIPLAVLTYNHTIW
jgi:hypothetical protein